MTEATNERVRGETAMRQHRAAHAQRTADTQAASLLPHLRAGMRVLDLGCGPGSVTSGLAEAVAPALTCGLDLDPGRVDGVAMIRGDVLRIPFADQTFDAVFASALLQHLADPLAALVEARRVARSGAVIAVVDADWGGELVHPTNAVLTRSQQVARGLREGTSPFVGRELRDLVTRAGFVRAEASARSMHYGTPQEVRDFGSFTASLFVHPAAVERAVAAGLADRDELAAMSRAWTTWAEHPGAFVARFWCEAVGWAP